MDSSSQPGQQTGRAWSESGYAFPYGPVNPKQSLPGALEGGALSVHCGVVPLEPPAAGGNNGPEVHTATQMDLQNPVLHEKMFYINKRVTKRERSL